MSMAIIPRQNNRNTWWEVLDLIAGIDATATQKFLLTLVQRHTNRKKGYAWASQETLAREMCTSRKTVERIFRWAKQDGVVGVRRIKTGKGKEDQFNEYWLVIERLKELQIEVEHPSPVRGGQWDKHPSNGEGAPLKWSTKHPSNAEEAPLTHVREGFEVKQYMNKAVDDESQTARVQPSQEKSTPPTTPPIDAFWDAYPTSKNYPSMPVSVSRAWAQIDGDNHLGEILIGLERWKKSEQWRTEQFVKGPAKFLTDKIFLVSPPSSRPAKPAFDHTTLKRL